MRKKNLLQLEKLYDSVLILLYDIHCDLYSIQKTICTFEKEICENSSEDYSLNENEIDEIDNRLDHLKRLVQQLRSYKETHKKILEKPSHPLVLGMWPVEDFEKIQKQAHCLEDLQYTAGILVADFRISDHREYILNYLHLFHRDSAEYIDFYIPGYEETNEGDFDCAIGRTKYRFNRSYFLLAIEQLREIYGIQYRGEPILILQEFDNDRPTPRRIEIEFSSKKAICLFEDIFNLAKKEVSLDAFSKELKKAQFKKSLPQIIRKIIDTMTGGKIFIVVMDKTDTLTRYNIKDRFLK